MRNLLYPRQKAAYVTAAQLRELKAQNIVIERDFSFGVKRAEEEHTTESSLNDEEGVVDVTIGLLSVNLSMM
jgi:FAD synthase